MRKPKDWGQPCPSLDCSHSRLMHRGNVSAISPSMTQSGKRRIFCCSKCARPFSDSNSRLCTVSLRLLRIDTLNRQGLANQR
jgi:hypothetical protein